DDDDDGVATTDPSPRASPPLPAPRLPAAPLHADKDPIWSFSKHDALRLVHVWHEEQGIMYPILDMDKVLRYTEMLFSFVEAAARSGLMQGALPGADSIMDDQTSVLKLVLAITLVMEGGGQDALGEKLFDNVQKVVERILSEPVSLQTISLLTLTGMYHFTRDDEGLAWRMIGLAARHCLELGLHRRETYATLFPDPDEQASAIRIFWSVYVLDRRWSLGTGMPFALQDADMDHNLPKPDVSTHTSTPYLNAMISYSAIGSKVWKSVASTSPTSPSDVKISKEDISFLDFQVLNWHRTIPSPLKFTHPDSISSPTPPPPRVLHRLQILLYLRANQMRILIYRPVLHTATTIMSHLDFAHTVVKVAKDTIRILTYVNQTSDIYRCQQTMFNYFLISGLAVLFLAVAHAPAEFSATCRDEFYMALDLVRGLSSDSHVSKRLWRTVRTLKEVGPRLGLVSEEMLRAEEQSNAAVAMAGLAGHAVDDVQLYHQRAANGSGSRSNNASAHHAASDHPAPAKLDTPQHMALDLTTLFEAAGGTFNLNGFDGLGGNGGLGGGGSDAYAGTVPAYGTENDELARIMKDLF
ncbi:fungal specific transcription factor, partial [Stagonosporopsis vannaccii]